MYSKKPLKQTEKQIIFQNNGSIVFYKPKFSKKTWQILLDNLWKGKLLKSKNLSIKM